MAVIGRTELFEGRYFWFQAAMPASITPLPSGKNSLTS
jgi:hypothetical protein